MIQAIDFAFDSQGKEVFCGDRLVPPYSGGDCQIVVISMDANTVFCSEIHQHAVRTRAFFNWHNAGRPPGDGKNFWLEAENYSLQNSTFRISKQGLLLSRFKKVRCNGSPC